MARHEHDDQETAGGHCCWHILHIWVQEVVVVGRVRQAVALYGLLMQIRQNLRIAVALRLRLRIFDRFQAFLGFLVFLA